MSVMFVSDVARYKITKENLPAHELIGLNVEVSKSSDTSLEGLCGRIIDETKNMLKIESKKGEKIIPKNKISLLVELPDKKKAELRGKELNAKPEDRIKLYWRKQHGM